MDNTNPNFINFKRERELGEILGDTFKFVRYNYKMLLKVIFKITGPVLLIVLLALLGYTYLQEKSGQSVFDLLGSTNEMADGGNFNSGFLIGTFGLSLLSLFYYAVLYASVNYCVQSYIDNRGEIDFDEVAENVRQTPGSFIGLTLLTSLIVVIGFMLFLVPGIYLLVPMALTFSIMVFKHYTIAGAISYSFKLIKGNWWASFFTILVMGIIYYLINGVFQIPAIIYFFIKIMTGTMEQQATGLASDWVFMGLSLIGGLMRFVLYVLMVICTVFIYFNLNEKKDQTGTFEAIDDLGEK